MTEPRARARQKNSTVFPIRDLEELLYAFGTATPALSSTLSTLDEILTDFIIETCHGAALCASYSRRQKIKADDFRWVLRHNGALLGRVAEHMAREKRIKEQKKNADSDFNQIAGVSKADLEGLVEVGGLETEVKKKGKGRRGKKRKPDDEAESGRPGKRMASQ